MKHKEIHNKPFETILKNSVIQQAAKLMVDSSVNFLVVEDFNGKILIGTVTDHDIALEVIDKVENMPKTVESKIGRQNVCSGEDTSQSTKENGSLNKDVQNKMPPIVHDKNGNETVH